MPVAETIFRKSRLLSAHGFVGLFSLRTGGVSSAPFDTLNLGQNLGDRPENVEKNLSILIDQAGLHDRPHQADQVHGTDVLICRGAGRNHSRQADILLSTELNRTVAVRTADCVPILLADPETGIVAAVHAGWRGTVQNVAGRAVQEMCERGARAKNILASLGPSIGPCCFTLSKDVWLSLKHLCGSREGNELGPYTADLAAINMTQLSRAGVISEHMERFHMCTHCQPGLFFSYRRDGGCTGRHLAIVGCPSDA
jgi:hypothetical protein